MSKKHQIPRTLLINDNLPPFVGGSITMTYNLSLGLDLSKSFAITQIPGGFTYASGLDDSVKIDMPQKGLPGVKEAYARGSRYGLSSLLIMLQIPKIVKEAVKAAKEIDAEVIMTCWPSHHFTIAAWLVARKLNIPLVVYYHSLWSETRQPWLERIMARFFERRISKSAQKVLVATPPTGAYLKSKFGIECGVIEHTFNSNIWRLNEPIVRVNKRPKNILMLGSVNKFNKDSVIAFSNAMAQTDNVKLTILTGQSTKELEQLGLNCSKITCFFCPREKLIETILGADALYVALGFDTPVPKETEVVIPTRLMDYLATGIPIIAHGPDSVWTLQEARNRKWGFCINSLNVEEVTKELDMFLEMPDYNEIVSSAWDEAKRRDFWNISKILADYLFETVKNHTK